MKTLNDSFKQNEFSRSLINESKLGAYFTDNEHSQRIGQLFQWPEEEEVCILEPSIGDAAAVCAVTSNCQNRKIFGVELNAKTFNELNEARKCDYLVNADFLNGVKISHSCFSFCFANPPYGVNQKERLEKLFLEKMTYYITPGGVLALIIPYYIIKDEKFQKCYLNRYNPYVIFKFDDKEYKKFHQIVIIGEKRREFGYMNTWMEYFKDIIGSLDRIPYLPLIGAEIQNKIPVPPSLESKVEYFTSLKFNLEEAGVNLVNSPLYSIIGEKGIIQPYQSIEIGHPPVPLKKDLLYLCAISGGGQGIVGSTDTQDIHLQRGVAKVVINKELVGDGEGGTNLVETSSTKIVLNIIENDGTITELE